MGQYYGVNGSSLQQQYKNHLSGFNQWEQKDHAQQWLLHAENVGSHVCIDEVALSQGELYTVVTNADARCQRGSLIAMVEGTKSADITEVLEKIPQKTRRQVSHVTVDLAANMEKAARDCFPDATIVSDRFHVQQLPTEALQEMRIKYRWEAIEKENKSIKQAKQQGTRYQPVIYENGDTRKQLLARSRYLLFKPQNKGTIKQKARAAILFKLYPDLKKAYELTMMFRSIYEKCKNTQQATKKLNQWYKKIDKYKFDSFITAAHSIKNHQNTILAYFNGRKTNAMAEAFNSKIKGFRTVFRGVRDVPFFLFRLSLIFA